MVRILPPTGTPQSLSALGYDDARWDQPWNLPRGQLTTGERMPSAELDPGGPAIAFPVGEPLDLDALRLTDPLTGRVMTGGQFLDRRLHTDGLAVVHEGR